MDTMKKVFIAQQINTRAGVQKNPQASNSSSLAEVQGTPRLLIFVDTTVEHSDDTSQSILLLASAIA